MLVVHVPVHRILWQCVHHAHPSFLTCSRAQGPRLNPGHAEWIQEPESNVPESAKVVQYEGPAVNLMMSTQYHTSFCCSHSRSQHGQSASASACIAPLHSSTTAYPLVGRPFCPVGQHACMHVCLCAYSTEPVPQCQPRPGLQQGQPVRTLASIWLRPLTPTIPLCR